MWGKSILSFLFCLVSPCRANPGLEYGDVRKMWSGPYPGRWGCTRYDSPIQGEPITRRKITHEHSKNAWECHCTTEKISQNVCAIEASVTQLSLKSHSGKHPWRCHPGPHTWSDLHRVGVEILDIWAGDILARFVNMLSFMAKGTLQVGWRLWMQRWSFPRLVQGSQT